jgi:hypothetical protein
MTRDILPSGVFPLPARQDPSQEEVRGVGVGPIQRKRNAAFTWIWSRRKRRHGFVSLKPRRRKNEKKGLEIPSSMSPLRAGD